MLIAPLFWEIHSVPLCTAFTDCKGNSCIFDKQKRTKHLSTPGLTPKPDDRADRGLGWYVLPIA